jgi:hypothetical protein
MPILLHKLYIENWNYVKFEKNNSDLIRKIYTHHYIFSSHYSILYNDVERMIRSTKYLNYLNIDKDFNKEKLVNIMRPYLYLYNLYYYNINTENATPFDSHKLLIHKSKNFINYNPNFGRKKCKIMNNSQYQFNFSLNKKTPKNYVNTKFKKKGILKIEFNEDHLDFNKEYKEQIPNLRNDQVDYNYFFRNSHIHFNFVIDDQYYISQSDDEEEESDGSVS